MDGRHDSKSGNDNDAYKEKTAKRWPSERRLQSQPGGGKKTAKIHERCAGDTPGCK